MTRDYNGALADLNQAIQLNPKFAQAYSYRAQAKYFLNDKTGACADWQKAVDFGDERAAGDLNKFCH